MKIYFQDEAADLLKAFYPEVKFDLYCEHVERYSAIFFYEASNGFEYKVSLEVVENEEENEAEIEYEISFRENVEDEWYAQYGDSMTVEKMSI